MIAAAVAVIRSSALRNNLQAVRRVAPGCRVLAVVKADAYGHGLTTVARILDAADGFAVARLEEALRLREAGIGQRIVVLGGCVGGDEVQQAIHQRLDLVVHTLDQVALLEALPAAPLDLWIKVDTGMGRLGLEPASLGEAQRRLGCWLAGRGTLRLMTHLASADVAGDPGTEAQLGQFASLAGAWPGDVSTANSAGILQWSRSWSRPADAGPQVNWVRPGLMLYGASPLSDRPAAEMGLQPAMSFETRLIAVRHLPRGRRVGYGGEWQARRDSLVGVAAAGYADGYPWHTPCNTPVLVAGRRAPVIGRVSMDLISIDLTDLPPARPGDRVVLWGDGLPVEEVAACTGRIAWDLLAGVSPRVMRLVED
ncbi:MAG: alanine racemase [Gammaproteobacteria bacterium]|nr:alanine racemase [Gammaproteobacteria bacterium]